MHYQVKFQPYQRRFQQPLHTSHGCWEIRAGIHLKLTDETGHSAWGEIAPIPWFGSETLEQAIDFCQQLGGEISDREINLISDHLPACQFGFESARAALAADFEPDETDEKFVAFCGLLPTGKAAIEGWRSLWQQGYRTLKWKIGVAPIASELILFDQLIQALPVFAKLRLDANGGLDFAAATMWLERCDRTSKIREFSLKSSIWNSHCHPHNLKQCSNLAIDLLRRSDWMNRWQRCTNSKRVMNEVGAAFLSLNLRSSVRPIACDNFAKLTRSMRYFRPRLKPKLDGKQD